MGKYQWQVHFPTFKSDMTCISILTTKQLFIVIGFGWAMDNLWPIVTSLILPAVRSEFHPTRAPVRTRMIIILTKLADH